MMSVSTVSSPSSETPGRTKNKFRFCHSPLKKGNAASCLVPVDDDNHVLRKFLGPSKVGRILDLLAPFTLQKVALQG